MKYLGRYLKRPPISASQLKHYSGGAVVHHYYDHHSQQHRRQILSQEEMIRRYVSHIPACHFKMIRYYGFLSNRKRESLLTRILLKLLRGNRHLSRKSLVTVSFLSCSKQSIHIKRLTEILLYFGDENALFEK